MADAALAASAAQQAATRAEAGPSLLVKRPSSHIPYGEWVQQWGSVEQRERAKRARAGGRSTLMLAEPWPTPHGLVPYVHGVQDAKELSRRLLEALRIAPALPAAAWARLLHEELATIAAWPAATRLRRQLEGLCGLGGHESLATLRTVLFHLDAFVQREEGWDPLAIFDRSVGAATLRDFLSARHARARARARTHARLPLQLAARSARTRLLASRYCTVERNCTAEHARMLAQQRKRMRERGVAVSESAQEEEGDASLSGAAARAHAALALASKAGLIRSAVECPQLAQFAKRPPTREEGSTVTPEIGDIVHLELLAADESQPWVVRACAAMSALEAHTCVRQALSKRSDPPEAVENGMAISLSGQDFKKMRWAVAGRPLICSRRGYSGSDVWYRIAMQVLEARARTLARTALAAGLRLLCPHA